MIKAEIVADSLDPRGNRLTSVLCTFPRIILAEVNTHRMLSKNTSSSRAIPFNKMIEAVETNPFIPIAWQKHHSGMQGNEYFGGGAPECIREWLVARDAAIEISTILNRGQVTKQLCNRLLEPFMWTTMLITGSKEGWVNFFELRCSQYNYLFEFYKSKKDVLKASKDGLYNDGRKLSDFMELDWLKINAGQAEIHIMDLAEKVYDAMNENTPRQLNPGEWHIPFEEKIPFVGNLTTNVDVNNIHWMDYDTQNKVKIATAMAARTSYTVIGQEKEVDFEKMISLHDRLISQDPPHSSPMEHCCLVVTEEEYNNSFKGREKGWFRNFKGFIQYRHLIENEKG